MRAARQNYWRRRSQNQNGDEKPKPGLRWDMETIAQTADAMAANVNFGGARFKYGTAEAGMEGLPPGCTVFSMDQIASDSTPAQITQDLGFAVKNGPVWP